MRPLRTQEKLTFQFTVYFSIFLLVMGFLFVAIFRILSINQIEKDLTHEFSEVTSDHIGMDDKGFYFKKDKFGDTLRTHLFGDNISALFLNDRYQLIRSYGAFESNKVLKQDRDNVMAAIHSAVRSNKVTNITLHWNEMTYTAFITPLKYNNRTVGSMLLAKSHEELQRVEQSIITVLGVLGGLGLLGSFVSGLFLTRNALSPIRKVIKSMEVTHLNRLEGKVDLKGNPDDEFVMLAHKYNEMLSRLNQMSSRQKEFIANASHELKTPLTRAILSLDGAIMQNKELPEEVKQAKDDLFELNNILEQLLVLGQVKEGGLPKGKSTIRKSLVTVLKRYESDLYLKRMSPKIAAEDFTVSVPDTYVQILFSNLISNAIKFSPSASGIYVAIDKSSRTFLVRDKGAGMTKEELDQIFERFYRGKSTRPTTHGYGLGLSLVKEICDGYGIKIHYDSEKGKGTTVTLIFPA